MIREYNPKSLVCYCGAEIKYAENAINPNQTWGLFFIEKQPSQINANMKITPF